jgi:hypothetical protein
MPLSSDTTQDFDVADASTYDCQDDPTNAVAPIACDVSTRIEFVAPGVARIIAGFFDTFYIKTPGIDTITPTWSYVHDVQVTAVEAVGYYHKFFVSFDGGNVFQTYRSNGWEPLQLGNLTLAQMLDLAMGIEQLEAVREWPMPSDFSLDPVDNVSLVFLILITRESGGGTGSISLITVNYMPTSADFMIGAFDGEPQEMVDSMPVGTSGAVIEPDYSVAKETLWPHLMTRTEMGYEIGMAIGTKPRLRYNLEWSPMSTADKDTLVDFLRDHQDVSFEWTPPGYGSARTFVAAEPEIEALANNSGAWRIKARLTETLAP